LLLLLKLMMARQVLTRVALAWRCRHQREDIRLFGDSDIRTDVDSGADDGGYYHLTADLSCFDDSDILAFARDAVR